MTEEMAGSTGKCANCSATFGPSAVGAFDKNGLEATGGGENRVKTRAKIVTFITEINGQDQAIRVFDALMEIYNLNWLHKFGEDEDILKSELILCSECSFVFSQLYKLFTEFQLLRKADSILSARLNAINNVLDAVLASSDLRVMNGEKLAITEDTSAAVANGDEANSENVKDSGTLDGVSAEHEFRIPGIMVVKREAEDFDELFPVITSSESMLLDDNVSDAVTDSGIGVSGPEDVEGAVVETLNEYHPFLEPSEIFKTGGEVDPIATPVLPGTHQNSDIVIDMTNQDSEEIFGLEYEPEPMNEVREDPLNEQNALPVNLVFPCVDCSLQFPKASLLGSHRAQVHGATHPFKCHLCLRVIGNAKNFRLHVMRHSDIRPYSCHLCLNKFKTTNDLRTHVYGVHTDEGRNSRRRRRLRQRLFGARSKLKGKAGGSKDHTCSVCKRGGFTAAGLYSHVVQCHGPKKTPATSAGIAATVQDPGFHECHYCGQVFVNESEFGRHLRSHSHQTIECKICYQKFANTVDHNQHCEEYHPDQPFLQVASSNGTSLQIPSSSANGVSGEKSTLAAATLKALARRIPVSTGPFGVTVTAVESSSPSSSHTGSARINGATAIYDEDWDSTESRKADSTGPRVPVPPTSPVRSSKNHHNLLQHLLRKKPTEKFSCNRCSEAFDTAVALGMHQYKAHSSSNKCKICKKTFPNFKSLNHHMRQHKDHCDEAVSSLRLPPGLPSLLPIPSVSVLSQPPATDPLSHPAPDTNDSSTMEEEYRFACLDCGEAFKRSSELGHHRSYAHESTEPFKCHICSNVFLKSDGLRVHMSRHAMEKQFKCDECGKTFINVNDLRNHRSRKHRSKQGSPASKNKQAEHQETNVKQVTIQYNRRAVKVHSCKMCPQAFFAVGDLANHMTSSHKVDFSFQCTICRCLVDTVEEWKTHMSSHRNLLETQCPICLKVISNKKNLWAHVRRHTDVRNFRCETCGRAFKVAQDYRRHMKRNHGDGVGHSSTGSVAVTEQTTANELFHFMLGGNPTTTENQDPGVITLE